jgi:hypothetical protein
MARAFGEGDARSAGALPGPKVDLPSGLIPKKYFKWRKPAASHGSL